MKSQAVFVVVLAAGVAATGCATKKYVREEVGRRRRARSDKPPPGRTSPT